jgi:acetyltransferase-like isoleucine patch superfamily enzyme
MSYNFFTKAVVYLNNIFSQAIFYRSKKYILSWGLHSYGQPKIVCYDGVSRLTVGDYVSIADRVSFLLGANHKRGLMVNYPRSKINSKVTQSETNERGDILVGNDVWIGYGATVIGPVTIGDGAIIGAGALVIEDVPSYVVAVGVPAKVVKKRFSEEQIEKLESCKWWVLPEEVLVDSEAALYGDNVENFVNVVSKKLASLKD